MNIQNTDNNKCFKWCLLRYLHPLDKNPAKITKIGKKLTRRLDFKDIKFPVKIIVFGYGNREKFPIYV